MPPFGGMTLTLPYTSGTNGVLRPYLWLYLRGVDGEPVLVQGIVDSGADYSCLPYGYATLLGYESGDLTAYQGGQVQGTLTFYRAGAALTAWLPADEASPFPIHPNFIEAADMTLWGRRDFFAAWRVGFNEPESAFSLTRA